MIWNITQGNNWFHTQHKILEVEKENTATQILLSSLGYMIKLLG